MNIAKISAKPTVSKLIMTQKSSFLPKRRRSQSVQNMQKMALPASIAISALTTSKISAGSVKASKCENDYEAPHDCWIGDFGTI